MIQINLKHLQQVCVHLDHAVDKDMVLVFTGQRAESVLLCSECMRRPLVESAPFWVTVDAAELQRLYDDCCLDGWRGEPEVVCRPGDSLAPLLTVDIGEANVLAFGALPQDRWLFYTAAGDFEVVDAAKPVSAQRYRVAQALVPETKLKYPHMRLRVQPRVLCDASGRFAAVVGDFGRYGVVVDLEQGRHTLTLDGGDYHFDMQEFSACFIEHQGRPVLVHRSDWNRLDASDPATGELLTVRESPHHRGEHDLNYFHGALAVAPDGRRILDSGWVWAPVGIPTVFDAQIWLQDNVWETEDGPSKAALLQLEDWNRGIWINNELIAIPQELDAFSPGADTSSYSRAPRKSMALLVPLRDQGRVTPLAGPRGRLFSDGVQLFSADENGLAVWDLADGAQTGFIPDFEPTVQHDGLGVLAQLRGSVLTLWRYR